MNLEIKKFEHIFLPVIPELTLLLQDAYKTLEPAGMTATINQSEETTLARLEKGMAYLAFLDRKLVGTITLVIDGSNEAIPYFRQPGVASFTQFAVSRLVQGQQVGVRLLEFTEGVAVKSGAKEIALDTSERAGGLISWYERRGYQFVEHFQLPGTNYRSVILRKRLSESR